MGSSTPAAASTPASPEFARAFRAQAAPGDTLSFARFMELALYHPELGYYRQARKRVGRAPGTDFYTATSSGPIFGELVAAACAKCLREAGRDPAAHTFVEIGAEPGSSILTGVTHPFAGVRTLRLGEALTLAGECVVFSNELFDAQPCVRTVFREGKWRELGVRIDVAGCLREIELPEEFATRQVGAEIENAPEGYHFDRPLAAAVLVERLAREPWRGLFVAFDYGKTYQALVQETSQGTARAYFRHTQSNDLLANPGEQDLTCHVCWDWLESALEREGFTRRSLQSQEAFLVHHAGTAIAAITAAEATRMSSRKLSLMQLLHPGNLGQKFQVLHAVR